MAEIAGLKLIVPSSVAGSGVSVLASGKVTFTAATSVSVNGCFTSSYDNYLIVTRHVASAGANMNIRLRLSGTDASGSNYTYQRLLADSTSVTGSRTSSQTAAFVGSLSNTARSGQHIYLYGPGLAQPTAGRNLDVDGYQSASIDDYAFTHSLSTAYDGFTLFPSGGANMTGACTIYGLSQ